MIGCCLAALSSLPALAPTPSAPANASPTLASARALLGHYDYGLALTQARTLLAEAEREHGPESPESAEVLDLLIDVWVQSGRWDTDELLSFAARLVRIRDVEGDDTVAFAGSLRRQADAFAAVGLYAEAEEALRRVLSAQEALYTADHPEIAGTLSALGRVLAFTGQREEARRVLGEALRIRETILGHDSPLVAETLEYLARALPGDDPARIAHLERALEIRERSQGPDHPDLARGLTLLGIQLRRNGQYVEARRLHERALKIQEVTFLPDDIRVGATLNRLAVTVYMQGDFAAARPLLERSLGIHEQALGPEHPEVAGVLNNLGLVNDEIGNYALAAKQLRRVYAIWRERMGDEHDRVARALTNLGGVLRHQGDLDGARRVLERAVEIREKLPGRGDLAVSLHSLALTVEASGQLARAGEILERTLAIQSELWGADHQQTAFTRAELGWLALKNGNYAAAERQIAAAYAALTRSVEPTHRFLPEAAASLAAARLLDGRCAPALESAVAAEGLARQRFRDATQVFSENEALQLTAARISGLDVGLTAVARCKTGLPAAAPRDVLDQLIRSRALVLDEMATRHPEYLRRASPDIEARIEDVQQAREELARLAVRGHQTSETGDYPSSLASARAAVELAERRLAVASRTFRQRLDRFTVGFEQVVGAIPHGAALVSYVHYRELDPDSPTRIRPAYLAFVLRRGDARPEVFALGDAGSIHRKVDRWRTEVTSAPPLLPAAAERAERRYREAGDDLRRVLWDPLGRAIGRSKLVLIVPDGPLHQVNFAALPSVDGDTYLPETGPTIHYLSAERDLLTDPPGSARGDGLFALGGPDFNALPGDSGAPRLTSRSLHVGRGPAASCPELRELRFERLPGARAEAGEIAALWANETEGRDEVVLLTGASAGEHTFKSMVSGRKVVHIATHGFFAPPSCRSSLQPAAPDRREAGVLELLENPLLHSGLALAGANKRNEVDPTSGADDGMLTAQEIASLDLGGAEWVVLSACETGIGQVRMGEGVLGLRRAFENAGAATLIMSLWEVKDEATRLWMRELYAARLAGESTAEAVHRARLRSIQRRRSEGLTTHPFYWGAFVAAGDWH